MRIGLFTDSYVPSVNGVITSVETLKKALEQKGHTVYIVTVGQDSKTYDYDGKEKILKIPGIPLGIYDYRMSSIYPLKVINKIKSWNLEIIHSHTELGLQCIIGGSDRIAVGFLAASFFTVSPGSSAGSQ